MTTDVLPDAVTDSLLSPDPAPSPADLWLRRWAALRPVTDHIQRLADDLPAEADDLHAVVDGLGLLTANRQQRHEVAAAKCTAVSSKWEDTKMFVDGVFALVSDRFAAALAARGRMGDLLPYGGLPAVLGHRFPLNDLDTKEQGPAVAVVFAADLSPDHPLRSAAATWDAPYDSRRQTALLLLGPAVPDGATFKPSRLWYSLTEAKQLTEAEADRARRFEANWKKKNDPPAGPAVTWSPEKRRAVEQALGILTNPAATDADKAAALDEAARLTKAGAA